MLYRLSSVIKGYAWGAPGAISSFLGKPASESPEAELWFGDHPVSGATLEVDGEERDLGVWLSESQRSFPLLVKLLAASRPLSIQVHPGEQQAREGFEKEDARGIPRDADSRIYKDSSAKPELIVALSDTFLALVGFVSHDVVRDRLNRWHEAGLESTAVEILLQQSAGSTKACVEWVLGGGSDVEDCVERLATWARKEKSSPHKGATTQEKHLLRSLCEAHPRDSGAIFGLLMHHVRLETGEALFVDAGEVHAYVEGFGLEVMLPSDNVVRAGLTAKHRDVEEFLALAKLDPVPGPIRVVPAVENSTSRYQDFPAPFVVTRIVGDVLYHLDGRDAILVIESGVGRLSGFEGACEVRQGDVLYGTSEDGQLTLAGHAVAWVAQPRSLQL
jgi:mannose-6-phosphate isomerase